MHRAIQRLRQIARLIGRDDFATLSLDDRQLPEALRNELQASILAKEIELNDLTGFEAELSELEAVIASYAGGPDSNDSDNDASPGKE